MAGPWKLSALGLVSLAAIVGTSTLSTAYLMRPPVSPPLAEPDTADLTGPARPAIVRIAPVAPHRLPAEAASRRDDCGAGRDRTVGMASPAQDADIRVRPDAPACGALRAASPTRPRDAQ